MAGNRLFGDFLRSRRTRLKPDKVGDPTRQRRRTPGLKREEVAQRAVLAPNGTSSWSKAVPSLPRPKRWTHSAALCGSIG